MSNQHEEDHTGPVKTPKQMLQLVFFSFVVPIFIIIGLVYYVVSGARPASVKEGGNANTVTLSGLNHTEQDKGLALRIQKIGSIEIRDANRALKSGEEVFKAQCTTCHVAGVAGAPKLGDAAAWSGRIKTGYVALLTSALKGKGAMGAQGGGDFEDAEIGSAVIYMANAAGAKFAPPAPKVAAAVLGGIAPTTATAAK